MARDEPQVNIRVPADLRARLAEAARNSGRSLTAEIVHRLERSFYSAADVASDSSDALRRVLDHLDQQRRELADARLGVFSEIFRRRTQELIEGGLKPEDASNQAYHEAHQAAYSE